MCAGQVDQLAQQGSLHSVVGRLPNGSPSGQIECNMRVPRPENPRLQALLDERDHIRVQISLGVSSENPDHGMLKELRTELASVEKLIAQCS